MSRQKRIRMEVCPQKGEWPWKVTQDGTKQDDYLTQRDAIAAATGFCRWLAESKGRWSTLKIKRPNGKIRDERTYPRSSDPRRSKG